MDLTGKWQGTLLYGNTYIAQRGKELHFEIDMIQDGNGITGKAKDIEGAGMSPDNAEIKGFYEKGKIFFIKKYERAHYSDGKGGTIFVDEIEGPEIHYEGKFDSNTNRISGKWKYPSVYQLFGFIPIKTSSGNGTWFIELQK